MARLRLRSTVDEQLFATARDLCPHPTDSALLDEALAAVITRHRAAIIDAAYEAHDAHPIDEVDGVG